MECPTIGHAPGDDGHFRIQDHACALELVNRRQEAGRALGDLVLTNLVNHTMPFIRYRTGDTSEALARADCPAQVLGPIIGRVDDVLTLADGRRFVHHHAYAIETMPVDGRMGKFKNIERLGVEAG
jgi:phenylacetate-coenzyme A ligase PaaK-like adenylate-forming protein